MSYTIEIKKPYKKLQTNKFELEKGINLLVGTNGSGKSSLLECLFEGNSTQSKNIKRIAYSSGINESFSLFYEKYIQQLSSKLNIQLSNMSYANEQSLSSSISISETCLFFTKKWFPFLVLAATFVKQTGGQTRQFLEELGLTIDKFEFQYNLLKKYRDKFNIRPSRAGIMRAGDNLGVDIEFIESPLDIFLRNLPIDEIDYSSASKSYKLPLDISEGKDPLDKILHHLSKQNMILKDNPQDFFNKLIALSHGKNPQLPLERVSIEFKNKDGITVNQHQLSDGEFQMLMISSLVDIFDSEDTFFLFDEIDAHIHPSKISTIWNKLYDLQGYLITSSHNLTSISITDVNKIYFLEDGIIQNEKRKVKEIIHAISGEYLNQQVYYNLCLKYKTLILIDGEDDWDIFIALCEKLKLDTNIFHTNEFLVVKCSSGSNKKSDLADLCDEKILWVENFWNQIKSLSFNNLIKLKNIVLLCDRDEYHLEEGKISFNVDKLFRKKLKFEFKIPGYEKNRDIKINLKGFIWNRRCIENYLISKSARSQFNFQINEQLLKQWEIPSNQIDNFNKNKNLFSQYYIGYTVDEELKHFSDNSLDNSKLRETIKCKGPIRSCISKDPRNINSGLCKKKLKEYIEKMEDFDFDESLHKYFEELSVLITSA